MVERKKVLFILPLVILIILAIFIFIQSASIKSVSLYNIKNVINQSSYTLLYSGDYNDSVRDELKKISKDYDVKVYLLSDDREDLQEYITYALDTDEKLKGNVYLVFNKTSLIGYIDDNYNKEEYLKKYFMNYIPVNERHYKEPNSEQLKEIIESKKASVIVFGEDECDFCKKLEQVINQIPDKYNIDINYINFSRLSETEANNIYNMGIIVPASCSKAGIDKDLKDGYAKPMTLVTKKGKVIGCIKGYYDISSYYSKLKDILE